MINWEEKEERLYRQFVFQDFISAWAFMSAVALISEKMDHHPNWSNVYNKVDIYLCTHDAGNQITEKDHRLAKAINQIADRFSMSL